MVTFDLKSEDEFRKACNHYLNNRPADAAQWTQDLIKFLQWVNAADLSARGTLKFHEILWDENPVSSVGQGRIAVTGVIADDQFRSWLAKVSMDPLPSIRTDRLGLLTDVYDQIVKRFRDAESRVPHLKIFRVLAALFPGDISTVADRAALEDLLRAMGRPRGSNPVERHMFVRNRIDEALGDPKGSIEDLVFRMQLPWFLCKTIGRNTEEEVVSETGTIPGQERLLPLPAARRRRGLTAIGGGFPFVLTILEFVKEGVTRQELVEFLRSNNPNSKDNSLGVTINALKSELGAIKMVDNAYVLTDRGSRTLESLDASDLAEWLLTRVLGIDHLLKKLEEGPQTKNDLVQLLQKVNPGWTTDFAPNAMITWLVSMKAIRKEHGGIYAIEPLGKEWTDRIYWAPEFLEQDVNIADVPTAEVPSSSPLEGPGLVLPSLDSIFQTVSQGGIFPRPLVESLHIGLWSHKVRHFAVLAGISGSGKTLLARVYAKALQAIGQEGQGRTWVEPVQPGWYDPTPLLGYLNPLSKTSYVRTPVLEFLLRASQDPTHPYVLILDEMNLSRPEQYFAPLLSRMETGGDITLHSEGQMFDGVPGAIPYPSNLAIIGTINMDETTHGLSDKVLDRAFTLEFWDIDLEQYPGWAKGRVPAEQETAIRSLLADLMSALAPVRLHFGWRVVDDLLLMMEGAVQMEATTGFRDLLDSFVIAKLLPKLRGEDSPRFLAALRQSAETLKKHDLKRSLARTNQLLADLERVGSAHFWR